MLSKARTEGIAPGPFLRGTIVTAAIAEDVQGVAVSSYQGGHVEYFHYLVDLLRERGAGHIKVYGGGGGVIVPEEVVWITRSEPAPAGPVGPVGPRSPSCPLPLPLLLAAWA